MIPILKPKLIDEFLGSQSESTAIQYRRDLERFFEFINYKSIESISIQDCILYKATLVNLAPNTRNRRLNTVKSYLKFNQRYGDLKTNPMECLPSSKIERFNPTQGLSNAEVESILIACKENPMHSAILSMLFYLGLRRSELCKLRIEDLNSDGELSTLRVQGKGGKQRMLPIPSVVSSALQLYLSLARASIREASDPIFTSNRARIKNSPLTPDAILKIFKKYSSHLNKRISPHSARVTAVSNALENGANPVYVQQMGGWSSMDMILLYDKRRKDLKNSAVFKINYGGTK